MGMSSKEKTVKQFLESCLSEGLSEGRINKYRYIMGKISKWLKPDFKEARKEDIQKLVIKINDSNYSDWTKHDCKVTIKKFYKWLEGDGEEFPKKVKWIKKGQVKSKKTAEDLLTEEEVKRMIENAYNTRDKAIISVLYESGCRISELTGLKIKSVQNKGNSLIHIQVYGKTGYRPIPLVNSIPYLSTWINNHPNRNNPESSLFVSVARNNNEPIGNATVSKMLRVVAERSGINKRVNPHNFRHTRASNLANKLKEPQMRVYFGWSRNSTMPGTYVHMSGRDIDNEILSINGINKPKEETTENTLASKQCPRCDKINEPTSTFCSKCMLPLTEQAIIEYEERINELLGFLSRKEILNKMIDERVENKVKEIRQIIS